MPGPLFLASPFFVIFVIMDQLQDLPQAPEPGSLPLENDLHESFCNEYLKDLNTARAARRAGFNGNNMNVMGYQTLQKPHVAARIEYLKKVRAEKVGVDNVYILQKLKNIAEANIADFVEFEYHKRLVHKVRWNDDAQVFEDDEPEEIIEPVLRWKDFSKLPAYKKAAIESMKTGKNGLEIKLHSKTFSLDMIAKHIGFFEKDNKQKGMLEHSGGIYLPDNGREDSMLPVVEKPTE